MAMLRRHWKLITVVLVVAVSAALPFLFRPPERRLLVLVTKVVSTKGWLIYEDDLCYQWLPGNRIFAWRSFMQYKCEPMEIDAATGDEIPLLTFHNRYSHPVSPLIGWQVSPDGKWLLWCGDYEPNTWTAVALDGSQEIRWPERGDRRISSESFGVWRPDSRSWVEIVRRIDVLHSYVNHLDASAVVQDTAVQEPKGGYALYLSDAVTMKEVVMVTQQSGGYGFRQFPIVSASAHATDLPLYVSDTALIRVKVTRDGRRVAWINEDYSQYQHPTTRMERFSEWLRRLLKQPQSASEPVQQLWVGDLDGKHKHMIGFIPPQQHAGKLQCLRWMPDEKHLSFIYHDTLYTVPAD